MSELDRTGMKCPVCDKEIMVDDILDMDFIARAKSQPDLLEACKRLCSLANDNRHPCGCDCALHLYLKTAKTIISKAEKQ